MMTTAAVWTEGYKLSDNRQLHCGGIMSAGEHEMSQSAIFN